VRRAAQGAAQGVRPHARGRARRALAHIDQCAPAGTAPRAAQGAGQGAPAPNTGEMRRRARRAGRSAGGARRARGPAPPRVSGGRGGGGDAPPDSVPFQPAPFPPPSSASAGDPARRPGGPQHTQPGVRIPGVRCGCGAQPPQACASTAETKRSPVIAGVPQRGRTHVSNGRSLVRSTATCARGSGPVVVDHLDEVVPPALRVPWRVGTSAARELVERLVASCVPGRGSPAGQRGARGHPTGDSMGGPG